MSNLRVRSDWLSSGKQPIATPIEFERATQNSIGFDGNQSVLLLWMKTDFGSV